MTPTTKQILTWTPRVLCGVLAALVAVSAGHRILTELGSGTIFMNFFDCLWRPFFIASIIGLSIRNEGYAAVVCVLFGVFSIFGGDYLFDPILLAIWMILTGIMFGISGYVNKTLTEKVW